MKKMESQSVGNRMNAENIKGAQLLAANKEG